MSTFTAILILAAICGVVALIRRGIDKSASKRADAFGELLKKPVSELTQAQKDMIIKKAELGFNTGHMTYQEYDHIRSKYTGTTSMTEFMGYEKAKAFSDKVAADKAYDSNKNGVVKGAAKGADIGGVVAGPLGAVVGAGVKGSKAYTAGKEVSRQKEEADARYQEALKK